MEIRERVHAVLEGDMPDRLPLLIYSGHLPRGAFERRMRNMGLGLDVRCTVYRSHTPNVRNETRTVGDYTDTEIITPVGRLNSRRRINLKFQLTGGSWVVKHPVASPEDMEVMEFVIQDTVYEPQYDDYRQLEGELGGDGVVTVGAPYTPLMQVIVGYMGFKNFAFAYRRDRKAVERILDVLDRKYLELYRIIAESPAEIVRIGDNIDELMVPAHLFERHCLPYYNKYARILKRAGKKAISHMDGRLKSLKALIGATELDAIEAFTPPPMGNLPIAEAREAWRGKALWLNFPETVLLQPAEEIRKYTLELMREMGNGAGYIIGITEDIHPDHYRKAMETLTTIVHEHGNLPLRLPPS